MLFSVIAGLGNPGAEYVNTRHNIGFQVVDAFAEQFKVTWKHDHRCGAQVSKISIAGSSVFLLKPQKYMNNSGSSIGAFLNFYKLCANALIVIYDEINLSTGRLKVSIGGSDGGHNGVADILRHLGNEFVRFRVGIGGKSHANMELKDHVLGRLNPDEQSIFQTQFNHYSEGLLLLLRAGSEQAMNYLNTRPKNNHNHEPDDNQKSIPC